MRMATDRLALIEVHEPCKWDITSTSSLRATVPLFKGFPAVGRSSWQWPGVSPLLLLLPGTAGLK